MPVNQNIDINRINISKVLAQILESHFRIYSVLKCIEEEGAGKGINYPPDDNDPNNHMFASVLWSDQHTILRPFPAEEYPSTKLLPFAKMPEEKQKKILYRTYFYMLKHLYFRRITLIFD